MAFNWRQYCLRESWRVARGAIAGLGRSVCFCCGAMFSNSANHSHGQLYDSFCIFDGLDAMALHAPANGKRLSGVIAAGFLKGRNSFVSEGGFGYG